MGAGVGAQSGRARWGPVMADLRTRWRNVRLPVLSAALAVTLGATLVGSYQYLDRSGDPATLPNVVYLSAQTFVLDLDPVGGDAGYPPALELARLLGPLLLGYATLAALLRVFRHAIDDGRGRRMKGHVVVCGLGGLGQLAVRAMRTQGHRVAVVEQDASTEAVTEVRGLGAVVVEGDATVPSTLERANVTAAERILIVCGTDEANGAVLAAVRGLLDAGSGPLVDVQVAMTSVDLADRLHRRSLRHEPSGRAAVDAFSVPELAARRLLVRHPPFSATDTTAQVAVVGGGSVTAALLLQLARLWRARPERTSGLDVRLAGPDASATMEALERQRPGIGDLLGCTIVGEPLVGPGIADALVSDPATPVYVCLDDESVGLAVALAISALLEHTGITVAQTLRPNGWPAALDIEGLATFAVDDVACDPETLFGGFGEELARAIHEAYRAERAADPETDPHDVSMRDWIDLTPDLRASNRSQARHIPVKLDAIGAVAVPVVGLAPAPFEFTADEVEDLAKLEHQRWVDEREAAGWTPGPKDPAKKTTPYLVDFADLPEHIQDYDTNAVVALPGHVAAVGYQIIRRS